MPLLKARLIRVIQVVLRKEFRDLVKDALKYFDRKGRSETSL